MLIGFLLILNFSVVWLLPIALQGFFFHNTVVGVLCRAAYVRMDKRMRPILGKAYRNPKNEEYAMTATLVLLSAIVSVLLYVRGTIGEWVYILCWVGAGGRCMGGAYTFAHKEAHNPYLYKWWRTNIFENWLGLMYGNVPYNFSTSHIFIHHALDGAKGDTFYMWDIPRNAKLSFVVYVERVLLHMCGVSPLRYFKQRKMLRQYDKLLRGCVCYWIVFPVALYLLTHSLRKLFFIWLQPLFAMTVFLAVINWAQHGFIELNEHGEHDRQVNATTIVDGRDDYFNENYHWEHHYTNDRVSTDRDARSASVFKRISIPELAVHMIFDQFEALRPHTDLDVVVMRRRAMATELQTAQKNLDGE